MNAVVCYYAHRLTDKDPAKQAENLARAELRCGQLRELWKRTHPERVLIAPWIDMAKAGMPELLVWPFILDAFWRVQVLIQDLDGGGLSEGMLKEKTFAGPTRVSTETIDGEIGGES